MHGFKIQSRSKIIFSRSNLYKTLLRSTRENVTLSGIEIFLCGFVADDRLALQMSSLQNSQSINWYLTVILSCPFLQGSLCNDVTIKQYNGPVRSQISNREVLKKVCIHRHFPNLLQ